MKSPSPDELFSIVLWLCHLFSPSLDWQTQIIRLHWKWCMVGFCLGNAVVISCNSLDTAQCTNTTGTSLNQPYMHVDYVMLRVHDDDGVLISVDKQHLFSWNLQNNLSFLLRFLCTSLERDYLLCGRTSWFILIRLNDSDVKSHLLQPAYCITKKFLKCDLQGIFIVKAVTFRESYRNIIHILLFCLCVTLCHIGVVLIQSSIT